MHLTQHELASLSFPIPIQTLSATSSHSPSSICQTSSFQFHFVFLSHWIFKRAASNATKQEKHFTRLFASQQATFSHVNGGKAKRRSKSNRKKTGAKQPIDNLPLSAELLKCDFFQSFSLASVQKKVVRWQWNEAKKCFNSPNIASKARQLNRASLLEER